jgi:serine/threonine protein kinase
LETYAIVSVVILALFFGAAILIAVRRRGQRCARCGAKLPHRASHCPVCRGSVLPSSVVEQESLPQAVSSPELVALQGPLAQQRFAIPSQGMTIGRHPDNDVELAEELMVSRHHAVITLEHGQYVLYDRDSANGTWVNEQRIFRHVLVPGDRIQIWQSQFAFATPDAPLPSPPPSAVPQATVHVVGERFCGYYLESVIGRGGMSEVFRARDAKGETVAIKILQETDPYLVAKFVQEGNKIGPLLRGHANVIYVHEFGQSPDNRLYIVMEYVDAPSLRKSIRRPRSEAETVKIVGQVCSALAFAHQNNVVHRDIKPENILITADGTAKVLDFGIAKLTSASTVTRDKIVGTPEYISPEQARGEPVRPASDVYSLGIVLYEILAGSVPFRRPRSEDPYKAAIEVVRQHLKENPEPVRKRNPNAQVTTRLERVTMRALKKDLKERFNTAKEMGQALGYRESGAPRISSTKPSAASLVILQGPRHGQRIPLTNPPLTLGRLDLGSANTTISRHHANILFRGGSYWLEDSSKNGTWVDNLRVYGEVPLKTGSIIVIGDNVLRLEKSPV